MMTTKKKTNSVKRKTVKKTPRKQAKAKAKPKVKEMIQTHAMEEAESFEKTTLDQVWGDEGYSKYGTLDEEKYTSTIRGLNKTDLHAHAVKTGILPVDNRQLLTSRLTREFKKYILGFRKPKSEPKRSKKVSNDIKSILAEGR